MKPTDHQAARRRYAAVAGNEQALAVNPAARVVFVYERIIHWVGQAIVLSERGEPADEAVDQALKVMAMGLRPWLDHQQGGVLAQQLDAMYERMERQLLLSRLQRDPQPLRQVLGTLLTLQSAWKQLAERDVNPAPALQK